ncbi:MAG: hypothetical protein IH892_02780 [Planctomycetes bacterium]|nr:hypothetical protein [Planctomycetota bacterium]
MPLEITSGLVDARLQYLQRAEGRPGTDRIVAAAAEALSHEAGGTRQVSTKVIEYLEAGSFTAQAVVVTWVPTVSTCSTTSVLTGSNGVSKVIVSAVKLPVVMRPSPRMLPK